MDRPGWHYSAIISPPPVHQAPTTHCLYPSTHVYRVLLERTTPIWEQLLRKNIKMHTHSWVPGFTREIFHTVLTKTRVAFQSSTGPFKLWPLLVGTLFHPAILLLNRTDSEFCRRTGRRLGMNSSSPFLPPTQSTRIHPTSFPGSQRKAVFFKFTAERVMPTVVLWPRHQCSHKTFTIFPLSIFPWRQTLIFQMCLCCTFKTYSDILL